MFLSIFVCLTILCNGWLNKKFNVSRNYEQMENRSPRACYRYGSIRL